MHWQSLPICLAHKKLVALRLIGENRVDIARFNGNRRSHSIIAQISRCVRSQRLSRLGLSASATHVDTPPAPRHDARRCRYSDWQERDNLCL